MNLMHGVELVTLMFLPSALAAAALHAPRVVAAVTARVAQRRDERTGPWTYAPPIEQIAADLRRLLAQHPAVVHAHDVPLRAHRLEALELAITSCADDAARALGLPPRPLLSHPAARSASLCRRELRQRLRELADAGMVLPACASLLADD